MSKGPENKPRIARTPEELRAMWIQDQFPTSMNCALLVDAQGRAFVDGKCVGWYSRGGTA